MVLLVVPELSLLRLLACPHAQGPLRSKALLNHLRRDYPSLALVIGPWVVAEVVVAGFCMWIFFFVFPGQ